MNDFLSSVTLRAPEYLWAVLLLPLLWWLLRLIPPEAIRRRFPSLRLLQNLPPLRPQTAFTPIGLLILRAVLVGLILVGFAEPVWTMGEKDLPPPDQPILLIMDNCWASVPNWEDMRANALSILEPLPPGQNIAVVAACPPDADAVISKGLISVPAARALLRHLKSRDEIADWPRALAAVQALDLAPVANVNVISSGVMDSGDARDRLLQALSAYDSTAIVLPFENHLPVKISVARSDQKIEVTVQRLIADDAANYSILARDKDHSPLAVAPVSFHAEDTTQTISLPIPPEATAEVATLGVSGMGALAETILGPPDIPARVGLVRGPGAPNRFLDPQTYVRAALSETTQLVEEGWPILLGQHLRVIISTERDMPSAKQPAIAEWVKNGGTLIRFAGNESAPQENDLMPTQPWNSLPDHTPAILERDIGEGRSLFVTVPPLPSAGDWVLGGSFPQTLVKMISNPAPDSAPPSPLSAIDFSSLVVLRADDLPDTIDVMDTGIPSFQTPLAPDAFVLAALLWIIDQALIVLRFSGLMWARR